MIFLVEVRVLIIYEIFFTKPVSFMKLYLFSSRGISLDGNSLVLKKIYHVFCFEVDVLGPWLGWLIH